VGTQKFFYVSSKPKTLLKFEKMFVRSNNNRKHIMGRFTRKKTGFKCLTKYLADERLNGEFSVSLRDTQQYFRDGVHIVPMTLDTFLNEWMTEIIDVFDLEEYELALTPTSYQVLCLVDISETRISTMDSSMKNKYRRAGKIRRDKLKNKFHYTNPFNRIHAYSIIENQPGNAEGKTISISSICSSNYSDVKGLGNFMMKQIISAATKSDYDNIVLEVGNEDATSREEDESEEESDDESEEEYESDEEEENHEELIDVVSNFLWKKSVRHNGGDPYYSFDEEYLRRTISFYLYNEEEEHEDIEIVLDDEEYSYGGFYYTIGKKSSTPLFNYYEKHGFIEDPKVNTEWQCFGETPYPSMILPLN